MSRCRRLSRTALPAAAIAAWMLAAALPAPTAAEDKPSWDSYRILTERNIFRRDRRRPRPAVTRTVVSVRPDDSDRRLVLTGVAATDAEPVAFFENARTGETLRVRVGESVGKGALKAVLLDAVEYEREGTTRRIGLGRSLAGTADAVLVRREPVVRPAPAVAKAPDANQPTTLPAEATIQPFEVTIDPFGVTIQPFEVTTQPSDVSPPPPTGDSDISDIEAQMRRRREQELRR